jgi:hypothetical protein
MVLDYLADSALAYRDSLENNLKTDRIGWGEDGFVEDTWGNLQVG